MTDDAGPLRPTLDILDRDVVPERWRQLKTVGHPRLRDGTGAAYYRAYAAEINAQCEAARLDSTLTWLQVLNAAGARVAAATERDDIRRQLVSVAATAVAWIECLDNRSGDREPRSSCCVALADSATLPLSETEDVPGVLVGV